MKDYNQYINEIEKIKEKLCEVNSYSEFETWIDDIKEPIRVEINGRYYRKEEIDELLEIEKTDESKDGE